MADSKDTENSNQPEQGHDDAQNLDDLTSLQRAPESLDRDARGDVAAEGETDSRGEDPSLVQSGQDQAVVRESLPEGANRRSTGVAVDQGSRTPPISPERSRDSSADDSLRHLGTGADAERSTRPQAERASVEARGELGPDHERREGDAGDRPPAGPSTGSPPPQTTAPAPDRKSTRLNSSHIQKSRMPSSA